MVGGFPPTPRRPIPTVHPARRTPQSSIMARGYGLAWTPRQLELGQAAAFVAKSGCAAPHQIPSAWVTEKTAQRLSLAAGSGGTGRSRLDLVAFWRDYCTRARTSDHPRAATNSGRASTQTAAGDGTAGTAASGCSDSRSTPHPEAQPRTTTTRSFPAPGPERLRSATGNGAPGYFLRLA